MRIFHWVRCRRVAKGRHCHGTLKNCRGRGLLTCVPVPDTSCDRLNISHNSSYYSGSITLSPNAPTLFFILDPGFTTLGGPQATISQYFSIFVVRKAWISERTYTELFGITQSLPGPGNAGFSWSVALIRNGILCAVISFFVWTIPSLAVYIGVAIALAISGGVAALPGWAVGIENGAVGAAVGLVSLAAFRLTNKVVLLNDLPVKPKPGMSADELKTIAHNRNKRVFAVTICTVTLLLVILVSAVWIFPVTMVVAGVAGFVYEFGHAKGYWAAATEWKERTFSGKKWKKRRQRSVNLESNGTNGSDPVEVTKSPNASTSNLAQRTAMKATLDPDPDSDSEDTDHPLPDSHSDSKLSLDNPTSPVSSIALELPTLHRRPSKTPSEIYKVSHALAVPDNVDTSAIPTRNDPNQITFSGHVASGSPPLAPYFPATKRNMIPLLIIYLSVLLSGFLLKFVNLGGRPGALYGMCVVIGTICFGGWGSLIPLLTNWAIEQNGFMTAGELTFLVALQNALPGPLFNTAGFFGALAFRNSGAGVMAVAGFAAFLAIFAPGMLLFSLVTPSYAAIRSKPAAGWIFSGINAAATGLMYQATYLVSIKSIVGRTNGASIMGYPVFLGIAIVTFVACSDFGGDGGGGVNPFWMILMGAAVGLIEWAIVLR